MLIPTTLHIKPEVANPLPPSFVFTISFVAFLETTTPITPSISPCVVLGLKEHQELR